jgi:CRISPR system Cascade subunit CasB
MSKPSPKETGFTNEWLAKLVPDRGAIAALRRGLGKPPGTIHVMDRYVLPFIAGEPDEPYYLVAALFAAWHQGKEKMVTAEGNLGKSLLAMVNLEQNREEAEKRIEKRLVALLNCHRDDLSQHLRQVVSLLKSKEVPINWAQLLHDIRNWNWESRDVQRSWARGFWSMTKTDSDNKNILKDIININKEGDEE